MTNNLSEREKIRTLFFNLTSKDAYFKTNRRYSDIFGFPKATLWSYVEEKAKRIANIPMERRLNSVKRFGLKAQNLIREDYFYMSYASVYKVIKIKPKTFTKYIKFFCDHELLDVTKTGMPARNYYRINWENCMAVLVEKMYEQFDDDEFPEDDFDEELDEESW